MKKRTIFLIIGALILLTTGVTLFIKKDDIRAFLAYRDKFTFRVTVSQNTPDEDIIYINITDIPPSQKDLPLKKVAPYTYEISFDKSELKEAYDFPKIKYRYNRNGMGFTTAEYLPDEVEREPNIAPEDEEGSNYAYRVVNFEKGYIQKDTIQRWRWFPEGEIVKEDISALGPTRVFAERIGDREFLSGAGIEDLYVYNMNPFFDKIANRIKDKGYNFVVLYPPLQMKEVDGAPKIVNDLENNPNYPNDEKLIEHIEAFKKRGLKVFLEPQLCCEMLDSSNKSKEWQNAYIDEVEKFLVHHAKVAQKAGVDALLFDTYQINQEMADYNQKMQNMFNELKKNYTGEVFAKVIPFLPEGANSPQGFIPDLDRMSWADDVDFFVYDAEGEMSSKSEPTEKELEEGAGKLIDLTKKIYEAFDKPVLIRSSYFAVKESWKSTSHYQSIKIPAEENYDLAYGNGGALSTYDQARVDNAFFNAISKRPWVIGFVHFGYYHWDLPTLPHWSIRGRTAEDLWVKWNNFIFKE